MRQGFPLAAAMRLPALSPVTWVTVEKLAQQVIWLVLFTILAPILGPRPYGLFSIVMVFVGFCEFVLSEGAVEALVTVEELDHAHTATANLASVVMALLLGLALFFSAPAIAALFHDAEISSLIWALTALPVLSLVSAAPTAVLRRTQQYRRLALRSIAGLSIGGAVGITLALAGAGVWALAAQVLAQRIAEMGIAWASVPLRFRLAWSDRHFRDMRPVALNVFAARVLIFAGGQLPRLILGYALGPTAVGLFTLAGRFLDIIVSTVLFPSVVVGRLELRTLAPGGPEFERRFAGMLQHTALLAFPVLLGAATLMPDLFRLWLDPRWSGGVIPAQLVVLGGLPLVLFYCFDAALLAARLPAVFRRAATVQALTTVATVLCVAPFGLNPTCLALAIRPWLLLPMYLALLRGRSLLPRRGMLGPPLRSLLGAVMMGAFLSLPVLRLPGIDPKVSFVGLIGAGVLFYGAFSYGFSRRELRAVLAELFAQLS